MQKHEHLVLLVVLALLACGGRIDLEGPGSITSVGGTTSVGGIQSTGCTGNLETPQSDTGLCVAKMVSISGPRGNSSYGVDATEVTMGQYDEWVATTPPLPPSTDANCGYVSSCAEHEPGDIHGVYAGPDADHHPVVGNLCQLRHTIGKSITYIVP